MSSGSKTTEIETKDKTLTVSLNIICGDNTPNNKEGIEIIKEVIAKFDNEKIFNMHEDSGFDNLIDQVNDVLTTKYGKQFYVDDTIEVKKILDKDADFDLYVEE